MSYYNRTISASGIYHTILRSVNQQIVFNDDEDFHKFLYFLKDCKEKYDANIFSYCLMSNHIHILIRISSENLSLFFNSLCSRFVRWYNRKYERSGHLFQGRFYSKCVENSEFFLTLFGYIHNNPVNAGYCRHPDEYYWSSHNAFFGANNEIVDTDFPSRVAGSKDKLLNFITDNNQTDTVSVLNNDYEIPEIKHYIPNEQIIDRYKELTGFESASDINKLSKFQRNRIVTLLSDNGFTYTQISLCCGISRSTAFRICKKYKSDYGTLPWVVKK